MKPHKISTHLAFSDNCYFHSFFISCLIELKFCEVSRNSISNWTLKFQLSILKNKKVLFLKFFLSCTAKIDPKDGVSRLNFPKGFAFRNEKDFIFFFLDNFIPKWPQWAMRPCVQFALQQPYFAHFSACFPFTWYNADLFVYLCMYVTQACMSYCLKAIYVWSLKSFIWNFMKYITRILTSAKYDRHPC